MANGMTRAEIAVLNVLDEEPRTSTEVAFRLPDFEAEEVAGALRSLWFRGFANRTKKGRRAAFARAR